MCTLEKRGNLFILTLTGATSKNDEHLLNPATMSSICSVLAEAKSRAVHGSALITLRGIVADLMAFPMPTIAAGVIMSHDYIIMTSSNGVMYMSELDLGPTFPDYVPALIRGKVGSGSAWRDLVVGATKVRVEVAVAMGIVDSAYDTAEEVVAAAVHMAEKLAKRGWSGKVYGEIRKALYPEVCGLLGLTDNIILPSNL
ncbi:hypothetical protein BUALT_Bualt14G0109900 [Buddleja alternifolia]|uniref:Uncharacterized protein n=1 Tax=Buddleja alternifolia TaxID=168488 RepID=A0AAV6WRB7_9LAMI|nr:hypothetical protein BUALT_Bualt14G0109900 [Buddleja alternifolia]